MLRTHNHAEPAISQFGHAPVLAVEPPEFGRIVERLGRAAELRHKVHEVAACAAGAGRGRAHRPRCSVGTVRRRLRCRCRPRSTTGSPVRALRNRCTHRLLLGCAHYRGIGLKLILQSKLKAASSASASEELSQKPELLDEIKAIEYRDRRLPCLGDAGQTRNAVQFRPRQWPCHAYSTVRRTA